MTARCSQNPGPVCFIRVPPPTLWFLSIPPPFPIPPPLPPTPHTHTLYLSSLGHCPQSQGPGTPVCYRCASPQTVCSLSPFPPPSPNQHTHPYLSSLEYCRKCAGKRLSDSTLPSESGSWYSCVLQCPHPQCSGLYLLTPPPPPHSSHTPYLSPLEYCRKCAGKRMRDSTLPSESGSWYSRVLRMRPTTSVLVSITPPPPPPLPSPILQHNAFKHTPSLPVITGVLQEVCREETEGQHAALRVGVLVLLCVADATHHQLPDVLPAEV